MITDRRHIDVRGLSVEVVRKDIRNLHVGVYPPDGRVRVAAPHRLGDEAVRLAIISRLAWIRRRRGEFERQERRSRRGARDRREPLVRGPALPARRGRARGPSAVRLLDNRTMLLRVRPDTGRDARETVLRRWYRCRLRGRLPALVAKWEPRVGVSVAEVRIRRMKTRWGSCNADAGRIWLNLELAGKPAMCLEYVLVHEMVHFLERRHGDRFRALMDGLMPQWRLHREELARAPLAHEDWRY